MLEDKLELILITYNRDTYLENTLKQLLNSPFKNCKFTILDNCSPDNTREVCEKYEKLFPNMIYKCHKINIGGNANILRAVETSTSKYTWILGDNDDYDFSECEDVIEAIDSERFDIIDVCSNMFPTEKKLKTKNLNEILDENNKIESTDKKSTREIYTLELINLIKGDYFMDMTFISGYIFRTKIYDTEAIIYGYDNIPNLFPHFTLINKTVEDNLFIYKSKQDLVIIRKNPKNDLFSYNNITKFNVGYLNSSLMIKDKRIRKICYQCLDQLTITDNYLVVLSLSIMVDKATGKDIKNDVISLIAVIYKLTGWFKGFFISLMLLIVYSIPSYIYRKLYEPVYTRQQKRL